MELALGTLVVVAVLAFVVLPLLRRQRPAAESARATDSTQERAAIYRELLELELDQKVGKVADADFQEQSDALLARAAALISEEDAASTDSDAAIEREIAETRRSLRDGRSTTAERTPAEETTAS